MRDILSEEWYEEFDLYTKELEKEQTLKDFTDKMLDYESVPDWAEQIFFENFEDLLL